mgnify:CR=1 FL=1|tara:strand:+ start:592 stop:858 length:267 start_codon:yes stop_codon:yes gene_type:complete
MALRREGCRHYDPTCDACTALRILNPVTACEGCDLFEPRKRGLGDVVEALIDVGTLGVAKKIAAKKGGCGCNKRRAALNRLTGGDGSG